MELAGSVNEYIEINDNRKVKLTMGGPVAAPQRRYHTVNLANGVTPFIMYFDGVQCASNRNLLTVNRARIAVGYYRPIPAEFHHCDAQVQEHVLRGGLMPAKLADAVVRQNPLDDIGENDDWETMQEKFRRMYGRRLPPLKDA